MFGADGPNPPGTPPEVFMVMPTDGGWVIRSRPPANRSAFGVFLLYGEYRAMRVPDEELSEQFPLVQEAVDRAEQYVWQTVTVYQSEGHYRANLIIFAELRARDLCRRERRVRARMKRAERMSRGQMTALLMRSADAEERRQDEAKFNEEFKVYRTALDALPTVQRDIITRKYGVAVTPTDRALAAEGVIGPGGERLDQQQVSRQRTAAEVRLDAAFEQADCGSEWRDHVRSREPSHPPVDGE